MAWGERQGWWGCTMLAMNGFKATANVMHQPLHRSAARSRATSDSSPMTTSSVVPIPHDAGERARSARRAPRRVGPGGWSVVSVLVVMGPAAQLAEAPTGGLGIGTQALSYAALQRSRSGVIAGVMRSAHATIDSLPAAYILMAFYVCLARYCGRSPIAKKVDHGRPNRLGSFRR